MKRKRKVLMINYYFPPVGGAGVKRMVKFVKYLNPLRWEPVVLTVRNPNHTLKDSTLINEFDPTVKIIRSYTFETLFKKSVSERTEDAVYISNDQLFGQPTFKKLIKSLYKSIGQYFKVPDSRILWLPAAFLAGVRSKIGDKYEIIYATGPTFTNMLVGALLKVSTGTPLVTDFRDAWVSDPMMNHQNILLFKINSILEHITISLSDRVISTNPHVTEDFRSRYPRQRRAKFITIYNGYDPDDFEDHEYPEQADGYHYNIVHTGRLYGERTPRYFLSVLGQLLEENPEFRGLIKVRLVGSCELFNDGCTVEDYINKYHLNGVVEMPGQVTRKKSLQYQHEADLLLLIIGIVPKSSAYTYGISGKIFDYFKTGKSVLTLSGEGSTRGFLEDNHVPNIFDHEQIDEIKDFLKSQISDKIEGRVQSYGMNYQFRKFELGKITEQLAESFDEILSGRN